MTKVIYIREEKKQTPNDPLSAVIKVSLDFLESSIARLVNKALPIRVRAK